MQIQPSGYRDGAPPVAVADPCRPQIPSSPYGSKLLYFQPHAKNQTSDGVPQDLFVVGADGSRLTRLTPPDMTTAVVLSYDSVSWSPTEPTSR